jgi:hypothetical protein
MLTFFMLTIQPKIVPDCFTTTSVAKTDVFGDIVSYVCGPSNFVRFRGLDGRAQGLDGPGTIHKHSLQFTDRHMQGRKNSPDSHPHQIALQSSSLPLVRAQTRRAGPQQASGKFRYTKTSSEVRSVGSARGQVGQFYYSAEV